MDTGAPLFGAGAVSHAQGLMTEAGTTNVLFDPLRARAARFNPSAHGRDVLGMNIHSNVPVIELVSASHVPSISTEMSDRMFDREDVDGRSGWDTRSIHSD